MMNTKKILMSLAVAVLLSGHVLGQGLPVEARKNIHTLFDNHEKLIRKVEITADGYVAITNSKDPKLVKVLQGHIKQMEQRLKSGRMVRGWDPAFREMVSHYKNMTHKVEMTKDGVKMTVVGKTPEAVKVAKNHAKIVSAFVKNGWKEHDILHPTISDKPQNGPEIKVGSKPQKSCCEKCSEKKEGTKAPKIDVPQKASCCKAAKGKCGKCNSSAPEK